MGDRASIFSHARDFNVTSGNFYAVGGNLVTVGGTGKSTISNMCIMSSFDQPVCLERRQSIEMAISRAVCFFLPIPNLGSSLKPCTTHS